MSRPSTAILPAALAALALPAPAQPLETVDQAIADISALAESLREIEPGLGTPNDFGTLYRLPDRQLMRSQGGLYAVFPQSVYGQDQEGRILPSVPPGTTFHIGPPAIMAGAAPGPSGMFPSRLNLRIVPDLIGEATDRTPPPVSAHDPADPPLSPRISKIVADPSYRADRVRALMRHAVERRRAATAATTATPPQSRAR
jgi:hypothetical protein